MRAFPEVNVGRPDIRSPGRYLLALADANRATVVLGVLYASVSIVAQALIPAAIGQAIDNGLTARDQQALLLWGAVVLALGVTHAITSILQDRCALTNSLGASFRTLQFVTRQATRLGAELPRRVAAGEVMNVGVADVGQIGAALSVVSRGVGAAAAIVVVATIMLTTSWQLGLIVLAGVPLMVWVLTVLLRPLHERQTRLRALQAEVTARAVDIVSGLRILRGIGGEAMFAQRYRAQSQQLRRAGVRVARVEALLDGAKVVLPGLLVALVVWLGARYVLAGRISPGQLVAFYGYAVFLALPLRRLTTAAGAIMKGHVAAARVTALLALRPELASAGSVDLSRHGAGLADPASGLDITPGRLTAVACALPADAHTLADRLGRYVDSDVTYGDVELRRLGLDEIRRRILVADNDARLFSGPMRAELDSADHRVDASERLEHAIAAASADDIVEALPAGLDTVLADAGREFSGGQQQRLRLVRALRADPEILVLVEPTSAVDAHTEARIAARLGPERAGETTVVFTTSPIVLDRADHVVFVQAEKVVAAGTHAELLTDPRYRAVVAREEEPM